MDLDPLVAQVRRKGDRRNVPHAQPPEAHRRIEVETLHIIEGGAIGRMPFEHPTLLADEKDHHRAEKKTGGDKKAGADDQAPFFSARSERRHCAATLDRAGRRASKKDLTSGTVELFISSTVPTWTIFFLAIIAIRSDTR